MFVSPTRLDYNAHMSNLAFMLIVTSSMTHAIWNLLVKKSRHKTVFIWWMFVISSTLFTMLLPFISEPFTWPDLRTAFMFTIGATCFVLYHLLNGRAYRSGDLSIVYPLTQTSIIYVPIWGFLLLGEQISLTGLCGILLVILGTYSVQLQRLAISDLLRPFRDLRSQSVQASLAAGFIYSIGSVAEKTGVNNYSPLHFTFFMVIMMLLLMSLNMLRPQYHPLILEEFRANWRPIMLSGPVIMTSFLTFRYGLNMTPVSYAVPVRQVSIIMGVLIGILFLKESFGRIRLVSAAVVLAGVFLIRMG